MSVVEYNIDKKSFRELLLDRRRLTKKVKSNSPYKNAATDGTDIGYDKDKYDILQGHVKDVSSSVSKSTVTITFKAPDSQPCHIDIFTNNRQFVTRVKNTSNQRSQSVSKDLPNGDYQYYVLCAVYQPGPNAFTINTPNAPGGTASVATQLKNSLGIAALFCFGLAFF